MFWQEVDCSGIEELKKELREWGFVYKDGYVKLTDKKGKYVNFSNGERCTLYNG